VEEWDFEFAIGCPHKNIESFKNDTGFPRGGLTHLVIHNYLVLIPQRLYSCGGIHNALQTDPYCFDAGFAVTLAS